MNYILEFDYAAIGITILTLFFLFTRKDLKKTDNRLLLTLSVMNIICIIADIVAVKVQLDVEHLGTGPGTFWNMLYLLVHTQMTLVLVLYVITLLGIRYRLKKWHWALMMLPSLISFTIVALNPFLHWYFYYNEQNVYSYGPLATVIFICPIIHLSMVIFIMFRYRMVLQKNMLIAMIIFFVTTMAAIGIQMVRRELLIELYMQSIGILGVMLAVDNKDEIRTLLTAMEKLNTERERAESANRSKSEFLAGMSHEIRTPINAVLGMNEMIMREVMQAKEEPPQTPEGVRKTAERIASHATDIRNAGRSLLSIINGILDFSKIESGKMELVEDGYRLGSVLNDISNMVFFRARAKGLHFEVEADETMPDGLYGDEVRIRQILTNLLSNAVKYTQEGSVTLTVRCEALPEGETGNPVVMYTAGSRYVSLIFSVKDTGIGIREEDREKLFEKFERVDLNKNKTVEGTGLGLAITDGLLQMMNGHIRVLSEYGKGSEFIVTIPQRVTDASFVGNFRARFEQGVLETEAYRERFRAPEARILVVDDTVVNLTVIKGLLEKTLIKINTATSGRQALEMTKDIPFDLILMDQRMPEMSGTETLHRLREQTDGVNANTIVVALTADVVQGAKARYVAEGFADLLSKPVESVQLETMLMAYLPGEKVQRTEAEDAVPGEMLQRTEAEGAVSGEIPSRFSEGEEKENTQGAAETGEEDFMGTALSADEARYAVETEGPVLLREYRALREVLRRLLGEEEETFADAVLPEMDSADLRELYGAIGEFSECYDIDSIDSLIGDALKYRIPDAEKERFAKLERAVRNSDWEMIREAVLDGQRALHEGV